MLMSSVNNNSLYSSSSSFYSQSSNSSNNNGSARQEKIQKIVTHLEGDCCICLDPFDKKELKKLYSIQACAHVFHKTCYDQLLNKSEGKISCPICSITERKYASSKEWNDKIPDIKNFLSSKSQEKEVKIKKEHKEKKESKKRKSTSHQQLSTHEQNKRKTLEKSDRAYAIHLDQQEKIKKKIRK